MYFFCCGSLGELEMGDIEMPATGEAEPAYIPKLYKYVLTAHGKSDFKECDDVTFNISDNMILHYFSNPFDKKTAICLQEGDERILCNKRIFSGVMFSSASEPKPPNLLLSNLTHQNTGFYDCQTNSWISAAGLGPVEPNPEKNEDYYNCLSIVLDIFARDFKIRYPRDVAYIFIAVCDISESTNLNTAIAHYPANGRLYPYPEFVKLTEEPSNTEENDTNKEMPNAAGAGPRGGYRTKVDRHKTRKPRRKIHYKKKKSTRRRS